MNDYEPQYHDRTRQAEYWWYYDRMLADADSVQVIGCLESQISEDKHLINRYCTVYDDTVYIERKILYPSHNIFTGIIRIDTTEYNINVILQ